MCAMGKTGMIACQISFYPLNTLDTSIPVKKVVEIIEASNLDAQVNDISTIVKGKRDDVMDLLKEIQDKMDEESCHFTMVITLSNICGCSI